MLKLSVDMNRIIETHDMLGLISGQLPGVTRAAVQDTLDEGRELAVDEVTSQINAPRSVINSRVGRTLAKRTTRLVVTGQIFLKDTPIKLRVFTPVQGQRGVYVRIHRGGEAKLIRGAFGPDIKRLGQGVFRRRGKQRTPIQREPGIDISKDAVAQSALAATESRLPELLKNKTNHHVERMLDGLNRGQTLYDIVYVEQQDDAGDGFKRVNL